MATAAGARLAAQESIAVRTPGMIEKLRALGDDAAQYPGLAKGDFFDDVTEAAVRHWQSGIGIVADGIVGPYCKALLDLETHPELKLKLTAPAVKTLFPGAKLSNVQRNLPYVLAALRATGLIDKPMILAALGTISASLVPARRSDPPSSTVSSRSRIQW